MNKIDMNKIDYVWTDGERELEFKGEAALDRARAVQQTFRLGKVWRREFGEDGLLEGVTDVTTDKS